MQEFEAEKDGFTVDFDHLGFMRDQDKYRRLRATGVLNYDDEDVSNLHKIQCILIVKSLIKNHDY